MQEIKYPYIVCWIIWNRNNPQWRPIYKFKHCSTEEKANKLKTNLLKQTNFIDIYITKRIELCKEK